MFAGLLTATQTDGYFRVMMQRYLSALLFIALASVFFADALAGYKAVRTANRHVETGNLAEAAVQYRNVIQQEPESPNGIVAAFNLGNTLFLEGRFAQAAVHFREIADNAGVPEELRADARFNAGNAFAKLAMTTDDGSGQKKKLLKAALREYREVLLIYPDDPESKINHEIILRLLKRLSSLPQTGKSSVSNAERSGPIQHEIASNILERAAQEEQTALRNRYRNSSRAKQAGSNRDW